MATVKSSGGGAPASLPSVATFTSHFGVTRGADDDWFDPFLSHDTPLFPDSFLVNASTDAMWSSSHDDLLQLLASSLNLIAKAAGRSKSLAWGKAETVLYFPEPDEFCLGYSRHAGTGRGTGRELTRSMMRGATAAIAHGLDDVRYLEELALLGGGIAHDRIGDMVGNVLKSRCIKYTQAVAERHGVATERVRVRHARWDQAELKWLDEICELPVNPYVARKGLDQQGVLLIPEDFLASTPTASSDAFWAHAWAEDGDTLRLSYNWAVDQRVDPAEIARLAGDRVDLLRSFLEGQSANPPRPYDFGVDAKSMVAGWTGGRDLADDLAPRLAVDSDASVCDVVDVLINQFRHLIQHGGAWRLLWVGDKPRPEKYCQLLFYVAALFSAEQANVDLTPEADAGTGPVDFKMSRGSRDRSLVEMKLASNTRYWHGLEEQVVQYAKSNRTHKCVYFLTVQYRDIDFTPKRMKRVQEVVAKVRHEMDVEVRVVFVDARPKVSASKMRVSGGTAERVKGAAKKRVAKKPRGLS